MQGIIKRVALSVAVLALVVPAPAMAQQSVTDPYKSTEVVDPGDPVDPVDPVDPGDPVAAAVSDEPSGDSTGGSLPFTGLDVGFLALAGAGLVALGIGMRRLTRRPDPA